MKKFNLNEHVYVKLNDKGKAFLDMKLAKQTKPDDKGFYKFQLWEFMNLFGVHLHMGTAISEENGIFFDERDLHDEVKNDKKLHYYYVSYQFNQGNTGGLGSTSVSWTNPLDTVQEIQNVKKHIERENHFDSVVLLNWHELIGVESLAKP